MVRGAADLGRPASQPPPGGAPVKGGSIVGERAVGRPRDGEPEPLSDEARPGRRFRPVHVGALQSGRTPSRAWGPRMRNAARDSRWISAGKPVTWPRKPVTSRASVAQEALRPSPLIVRAVLEVTNLQVGKNFGVLASEAVRRFAGRVPGASCSISTSAVEDSVQSRTHPPRGTMVSGPSLDGTITCPRPPDIEVAGGESHTGAMSSQSRPLSSTGLAGCCSGSARSGSPRSAAVCVARRTSSALRAPGCGSAGADRRSREFVRSPGDSSAALWRSTASPPRARGNRRSHRLAEPAGAWSVAVTWLRNSLGSRLRVKVETIRPTRSSQGAETGQRTLHVLTAPSPRGHASRTETERRPGGGRRTLRACSPRAETHREPSSSAPTWSYGPAGAWTETRR